MELTGILFEKTDVKQISEKFKVLDFVLEDNSTQYKQHIAFQLVQEKCDRLNNVPIGAEIKVWFGIKGRKWTSPQGQVKYFNTLDAWRIDVIGGTGKIKEEFPPSATTPTSQNTSEAEHEKEDDLPF